MEREIKYAVQYAYDAGVHNHMVSWSNVKIVEDTNPISYDDAVKIFNSHLDDFAYRLKGEERPQLCIWKDVGDGESPIYSETLVDLDWRDDLELRNGKYYKVQTSKEEVELP